MLMGEKLGRRVIVASLNSEEKIRRDGDTRSHVLENKSLVFKLLPLRRSERVPVSCSTHFFHTQAKQSREEKVFFSVF